MSLTQDQITANNFKDFYNWLRPYLGIKPSAGFTPIGTVITVMGDAAPTGYLICDGTEYLIADYPELTDFFEEKFGSKNYFGGDGTSTFKVPNMVPPKELSVYCIAVKNLVVDGRPQTIPDVQFVTPRWLRFDPDNKKGLVIKAGTVIKTPNGLYRDFASDKHYDLSSLITEAGKDYFVFIDNNLDLSCTTNKSSGTGLLYIGRFHTLCVSAGTITMISPASPSSGITTGSNYLIKPYNESTDPDFYAFYNKSVTAVSAGSPYDVITTNHPLSGFSAGDILPESVFCTSFKPSALFEDAMVYDRGTDLFVDVYLQSGTGMNTRSEYNKTHTVNRQSVNHASDFNLVGKRFLFDNEFTSIALGSNETTNITGSSDKGTVGGHVDTNSRRMISAIGCEECCGYLWQWLNDLVGWQTDSWGTRDGRGSFGQEYRDPLVLIAGGGWVNGSHCGSRSRAAPHSRSSVDADLGSRGACGRG